MSGNRLASICVGVEEYADRRLAASEDKLNHASSDAAWFHEYCKNADKEPKRDDRHILLQGRAATRSAVESAFAALAACGDCGLIFIFFAGHGAKGGWFSCADAEWAKPDIDGAFLDRLLAPLHARRVLVLVDCCFAASIAAGSRYFTQLADGAVSRVFLASSGADQRSWEARDIGSGLFTHIIRNALLSAPGNTTVSLDGIIFPALQKELPLLALRAKQGAAQEPVRVGACAEELLLPHAVASRPFAPESVRRTVLSLLRSVAYATLALVLIALMAIEYCTYHFAVENGKIAVRYGVRELAWLIPRGIITRTATGISEGNLERLVLVGPGEQERSRREVFANENTNGVWLQKNSYGVRRWSTHLTHFLNDTASSKIEVDLTGHAPEGWGGAINRPSNDLPIRAMALGVATSANWRDLLDFEKSLACLSGANRPAASISDLSDGELFERLETLRDAASVGMADSFDLFVGAVRAVASRAAGEDIDRTIARARVLAAVMSSIAAYRLSKGATALSPTERKTLQTLADSGCNPLVAVSAVAADPETERWEKPIYDQLAEEGAGELDVKKTIALDGALRLGSMGRPVAQAALSILGSSALPDEVMSLFRSVEGRWTVPIVGTQIARAWLSAVELRASQGRLDSVGPQLVLAASQAPILSDGEVERLRSLTLKASMLQGMRSEAKIADSYLVRSRRMEASRLESMISGVDWKQPVLPFRDGGYLVLGGGQPVSGIELGAIGRALQRTCVSANAIEGVYDFAARNDFAHELVDLLFGLAAQKPWNAYLTLDAHGAVAKLASRVASWSDENRRLEVKLFAAAADSWSSNVRQSVLAELRLRWTSEVEYEIRSSLADAVVALALRRTVGMSAIRPLRCDAS
jgi:hypothetical protein